MSSGVSAASRRVEGEMRRGEGERERGEAERERESKRCYMLESGSDSNPSSDSEAESKSESESESEPETDSPPPNLPVLREEGILQKLPDQTQTQPRTEGELQIHSILECGCEVMTCQFNDEGSLLAVGLSDGTIKLFSPGSGNLVQTLRDGSSFLSSLPVTALRFSYSARSHCLLLATYASGCVRCWYVWERECMWVVPETGETVGGGEGGRQRQTLSLSVCPSGDKAATGGSDSAIHLYDLTTHQRLTTYRASSSRAVMDGHRFRVFAVTFHPEKEREFISGGWDNTVQFWDVRQPHSVRMLSGPHVCGDALQIDPATNHILTGSWRKNHALEIWDYGSGQKVCDVPPDNQGDSKIYSCHWLGQDHMVAAGSQANMLRVINRQTMMTESRLLGLSSGVFSSSVCPSGRLQGLVAAAFGTRVCLLERGAPRRAAL